MLFNYFAIKIFVVVYMLIGSVGASAQILKLGESEVRGEKARPETTTFISRAPSATEKSTVVPDGKETIQREIEGMKIFDVFYRE